MVGEPSPTRHLLDPVSKRIIRDGRPYRALRPIEPEEARLFQALLDGKFLLQGFHNRDIRRMLYPATESNSAQRRQVSGRITRLLRLFRAHGLIQKVSHTLYYRVTNRGQHVMTTALRLRKSTLPLWRHETLSKKQNSTLLQCGAWERGENLFLDARSGARPRLAYRATSSAIRRIPSRTTSGGWAKLTRRHSCDAATAHAAHRRNIRRARRGHPAASSADRVPSW